MRTHPHRTDADKIEITMDGTAKTPRTPSTKWLGKISGFIRRSSFYESWRSWRLQCRQVDTAFCGIFTSRNSSFRATPGKEDLWLRPLFS
jgi:hypothetical protein